MANNNTNSKVNGPGKNNSQTKYVVMLVIFTTLFFIGMVICVTKIRGAATALHYTSLKGRLQTIENSENFYGPACLYSELMMDDDYEENFDYYWEFANLTRTYIIGRYAENPSEQLAVLNKYVDSCTDSARKRQALEYIELIEKNH